MENRERRQLYQSALDGSSQAEGQSEDGATGTTMRLENEIEQARKQQLEVSALTGAAPQVRFSAVALVRVVRIPEHQSIRSSTRYSTWHQIPTEAIRYSRGDTLKPFRASLVSDW